MGGSRSIGRCSNFARAQIHPLVMSTALFGFVTFLYERSFPMRLLIVRHADPDYSIDSLTPAGWEEAKLLADRLASVLVAAYYVSPLGRAKTRRP